MCDGPIIFQTEWRHNDHVRYRKSSRNNASADHTATMQRPSESRASPRSTNATEQIMQVKLSSLENLYEFTKRAIWCIYTVYVW